jgi:hypothetical protein
MILNYIYVHTRSSRTSAASSSPCPQDRCLPASPRPGRAALSASCTSISTLFVANLGDSGLYWGRSAAPNRLPHGSCAVSTILIANQEEAGAHMDDVCHQAWDLENEGPQDISLLSESFVLYSDISDCYILCLCRCRCPDQWVICTWNMRITTQDC